MSSTTPGSRGSDSSHVERVAVRLQAVNFAEADQPVCLEGLQDRVGEPAGGHGGFATTGEGCREAGRRSGSKPAGSGLDEAASSGRWHVLGGHRDIPP
jgi:hypothetical protein